MKHLQWIDGKLEESPTKREVRNPFDGSLAGETFQADAAQMERAIAASTRAFRQYRHSSGFLRGRLLAAMADGISRRRMDLVSRIVAEAGKPKLLSDAEVSRAVSTFTIAAEESKRLGGEILPIDRDPGSRAYTPAFTTWSARGPVLAITPFNFPLNLVAHKLAPALAVGASVVLKPPPQAPGAAMLLADIFAEAAKAAGDATEQVPLAVFQVVHGSNEVIGKAVSDERMAILSFTGSDRVGWLLQSHAVRKKVALELGGDAAVIVTAGADLKRAAARIAYGAFAYAGQICISVQRIVVERSVATEFEKLFLEEVKKVRVGNPAADDTMVGPLIDAANAARIVEWIEEARAQGARVLCGGTRDGNVVAPTVLSGVKPTSRLSCQEAFGPVVLLDSFEDFSEALERVNTSKFGLQAGIFSDSASRIARACAELDVGGVIVNDVPTFRADNMPYGGIKNSGLGREGVRYAMEDFCERKVVVGWRG